MLSLRHPPRSLTELRGDLLRIGLGTAYSLRPKRLAVLPRLIAATLRTTLRLEAPDSYLERRSTPHPSGFVGICGALDPDTLMRGFRQGFFPFSHVGPKKWWMHPQRMTLAPHLIERDKDVRRLLRNQRYAVSFDHSFEAVMRACAAPRKGQAPLTWITEDIIEAYIALHHAGHAHSFEAWNAEGELVGGGFGIAVGPIFVIESQFTRQRNASKVAMVTVMRHLSAWGFVLADGKAHTDYLERVGFRLVAHEDYMTVLGDGLSPVGPTGNWSVDGTLDASEDWQPTASPPRPPAAVHMPTAASMLEASGTEPRSRSNTRSREEK